jgi:uncharacterized protein YggE
MRRFAFLLLALSLPLAAPAAAQPEPPLRHERVLAVVGEGTVRGLPDMAVITMGVVSEAKSAGEALAANTASMTSILAALRDEGLESRDLQTSNFSVEPRYSQPPRDWNGQDPFEPKIVGYAVRNDLTLRIRDLDRVGALLDLVITLGANSVSGPMFTVADPSELEDQARRAAMRDAVRKGELYSQSAGVPLGPIARIEENVAQWPQPVPMGAMARQEMAADAAVPIEGGELTFRAQISVAWELGPAQP